MFSFVIIQTLNQKYGKPFIYIIIISVSSENFNTTNVTC